MTAKPENILLASLEERWKNYRAQLKICRREFSEEAVHDLRVAARRLLAVLDLIRAIDPRPNVQKARKNLKGKLDSFDDLRDVQVMLVEAVESIDALPQLKPFTAHLHKREKILLRVARKQTKISHPSELSKRINKIHNVLENFLSNEELNTLLPRTADHTFMRAVQAYGQIDAAQPATIHNLRIAFKKFRYTVEVLHPILPGYPDGLLDCMHDYQSRMGDIQDVDVFLNFLAEFSESNAGSLDLGPVRHSFEARRAELIAAYLEHKDELNTFWRSAPDQSFPWEKKNEPVHRSPRNRRGTGDSRLRRRQPASPDEPGTQENAQDSKRSEGAGETDRPDPDQPLSTSHTDSRSPGKDT
jgi:CHAD domain-containing protein